MGTVKTIPMTNTEFANLGDTLTTRDPMKKATISFAIAKYISVLKFKRDLGQGQTNRIIDNINMVAVIDVEGVKDCIDKFLQIQINATNLYPFTRVPKSTGEIFGPSYVFGESMLLAVDENIDLYNNIIAQLSMFEFVTD